MAIYTYVGNKRVHDGTKVVKIDNLVIGLGQSANLTAPQLDSVSERFVFQPGVISSLAPVEDNRYVSKTELDATLSGGVQVARMIVEGPVTLGDYDDERSYPIPGTEIEIPGFHVTLGSHVYIESRNASISTIDVHSYAFGQSTPSPVEDGLVAGAPSVTAEQGPDFVGDHDIGYTYDGGASFGLSGSFPSKWAIIVKANGGTAEFLTIRATIVYIPK